MLTRIGAEFKDLADRSIAQLKSQYGLGEEWLERFEQSRRPDARGDYWNAEIQRVPKTSSLEDAVSSVYDQLRSTVADEWIRTQAEHRYRQSYNDPADCRLHIVGRQRLLPRDAHARPHRFAQMLLVCEDLLRGRHDIDLFDGPLLLGEAAALGAALPVVPNMGAEAVLKLKSLASLPDRDVAPTVYELVVGAACVRQGRDVEMLAASGAQKTPDFRIHDLVVPVVVECKRRLGLSTYAEKEARQVERLFDLASPLFERHHPHVEVEFSANVEDVAGTDFVSVIQALCESSQGEAEEETTWGRIRMRRAPSSQRCPPTRVFSPAFLLDVFGWDHVESGWDGLLCQIDPVPSPVISTVRWPHSLKWKCNSDTSRLKKSRGLTSVWADAAKQIPTGEVGCIYIAYTENMRADIADARTQHLMDSVTKRELFHRPHIQVPFTVIGRLYPQALGNGGPEIIESAIPLVETNHEHMLDEFPTCVFTRPG